MKSTSIMVYFWDRMSKTIHFFKGFNLFQAILCFDFFCKMFIREKITTLFLLSCCCYYCLYYYYYPCSSSSAKFLILYMKNVPFISWFNGTWQRKLAIKDLKVLNHFQKKSTILDKIFCIFAKIFHALHKKPSIPFTSRAVKQLKT